MSKVAIKGNASGTGTFTLEAPNSNTDRTLVLPDEAGTVLTSASAIPVANLDSAVGITHSSQYRLDTTVSISSSGDILTNWVLGHNFSYGSLGTAVGHSSGTFTFPSNGIWLVVNVSGHFSSSGGVAYMGTRMRLSTDNGSSFSIVTSDMYSSVSTTNYMNSATQLSTFDVTDYTQTQFRLEGITNNTGSARWLGSTNEVRTTVTFIRLGDT